MQRYFLNIIDSHGRLNDPEGSHHPDIAAARAEAIASARELMCHAITAEGRIGLHRIVEITDEHGHVLLEVLFREAAA